MKDTTTAAVEDFRTRRQNAELDADRERSKGNHDSAMFCDGKAEAFAQAVDVLLSHSHGYAGELVVEYWRPRWETASELYENEVAENQRLREVIADYQSEIDVLTRQHYTLWNETH